MAVSKRTARRGTRRLVLVAAAAASFVVALALLVERGRGGASAPGERERVAVVPGLLDGERARVGEEEEPGAPALAPGVPSSDAPAGKRVAVRRPGTFLTLPGGEVVDLVADDPDRTLRSWSGRVLEHGTRRPIPGARVVLTHNRTQAEAIVDREGEFELAWPEDLPADLAVVHPRFVDLRAPSADLERDAEFALTPSAAILGWVEPWSGVGEGETARAWVWRHDAPRRAWDAELEVPLDADGRFAFSDLSPGAWNVAAVVAGEVVRFELALELEAGERREVPLRAGRGATARGSVLLEATREPVRGVELVARATDVVVPGVVGRALERAARTDATGAFELRGLASGGHRIELRLPWGPTVRRSIEVSASLESLTEDFLVPGPARVSGTVLDAGGGPAAGARVIGTSKGERAAVQALLRGEALDGVSHAVCGGDGSFELEGLPSERKLYVVAVPADGPEAGPAASAVVEPLAAGEEAHDVRVTLAAGRSIRGRVLCDDGLPAAGAEVKLSAILNRAATGYARVACDPEGFFELEAVPSAALDVQARAPGHRDARVRVHAGDQDVHDLTLRIRRAYAVAGAVVDVDGFAVSGVTVRLTIEEGSPEALALEAAGGKGMRHADAANSYGRVRFDPVAAGHWIPSLRGNDWELVEARPRRLRVPGDEELTVVVRRVPRVELAGVTGVVHTADGGELVDLRMQGLRGAAVQTEGGEFEASGVEPGTVRVRLVADGYVPVRRGPFDVQPGEVYDLGAIELQPGTRFTVKLRDPKNRPVERAKVLLRPLSKVVGGPEGARSHKLTAVGKGVYRSNAAPRGRWRLKVARNGYHPHSELLEVRAEEKQTKTVRLKPKP